MRAFRASSRCRAAVSRLSAFGQAFSSRSTLARCALKESRAAFAPALLSCAVVGFLDFKQRARERFRVPRIRAGGDDQLAKLLDAALFQLLRF